MLDLITKEELNEERSIKDIDEDNGEKFKKLIEDKFLNQRELAEYFNCSIATVRNKIKKYEINYKKKSHKQFVYEIKKRFGDKYEVLGKYKNSNTKIKIKHRKCGHIYETKPRTIWSGGVCPNCIDEKTTEDFKKTIYDLVGNEYTLLGEYINKYLKTELKHNVCGHVYKDNPKDFMSGKRCPKCHDNDDFKDRYEKNMLKLTAIASIPEEPFVPYTPEPDIPYYMEDEYA